MKTVSLPRLAVMPCPQHAGKHPFHDQRWIVTEGTAIEHGHDPRPDQWHTVGGSLVAEMRDCEFGTAEAIVRACNSHAAMLEALKRLPFHVRLCRDSVCRGNSAEELKLVAQMTAFAVEVEALIERAEGRT